MSVKLNVHYFLPGLTDDQDIVEVEGNSVGQCLKQLISRFPRTRDWLFAEDGSLSNLVDVYVNLKDTTSSGLGEPVNDGDEIHLVMMLSGG